MHKGVLMEPDLTTIKKSKLRNLKNEEIPVEFSLVESHAKQD